eukprot:TRINITY_DN17_c0_g2_i3.p1 TRINITY_DN17_c0_g2~~TRINITY_DN17_c0_g2_i3.p1  ORF type:complete len:1287 (+),score=331.67 TRINITY_DN17_c0_g2_i3:49-3861(+)
MSEDQKRGYLVVDPTLASVLVASGWRTIEEISGMTKQEQRNTLIAKMSHSTKSIEFQGMTDERLIEAGAIFVCLRDAKVRASHELLLMSAEDHRKTLIVELHASSNVSVASLERMWGFDLINLAFDFLEGLKGEKREKKDGEYTHTFFAEDRGSPMSIDESEIETGLLEDFIRDYIDERRASHREDDLKEASRFVENLSSLRDYLRKTDEEIIGMFELKDDEEIGYFRNKIFEKVWKLTTRVNARPPAKQSEIGVRVPGWTQEDAAAMEFVPTLMEVFVEPYLRVLTLQEQIISLLKTHADHLESEEKGVEKLIVYASARPIKKIVLFGCKAKKHHLVAEALLQQNIDFDVLRGNNSVSIWKFVLDSAVPVTIQSNKMEIRTQGELLSNGFSIVLVDQDALKSCATMVLEELKEATIFIPVLEDNVQENLGIIRSFFTHSMGNDFDERGFVIISSSAQDDEKNIDTLFTLKPIYSAQVNFHEGSIATGAHQTDLLKALIQIKKSSCVQLSAQYHLSSVINRISGELMSVLDRMVLPQLNTTRAKLIVDRIDAFLKYDFGLSDYKDLSDDATERFEMIMRMESEKRRVNSIVNGDDQDKHNKLAYRVYISLHILCRKLFLPDNSYFQLMLRDWCTISDDLIFTPKNNVPMSELSVFPDQSSDVFKRYFAELDSFNTSEKALETMKICLRSTLYIRIDVLFERMRENIGAIRRKYIHVLGNADPPKILFEVYARIISIGFSEFRGNVLSTCAWVSHDDQIRQTFGDGFFETQLRDGKKVLICQFTNPEDDDGPVRELFAHRIMETSCSKRVFPLVGLVKVHDVDGDEKLFIAYDVHPANTTCSWAFDDENVSSTPKKRRILFQLLELALELRKNDVSLSFLTERSLFWSGRDSLLKVLSLHGAVVLPKTSEDDKGWGVFWELVDKFREKRPDIPDEFEFNLGENPGEPDVIRILTSETKWNVMTIDGGGCRGIVAAKIVAAIESRIGGIVSDAFHLFGGTSAGGLNSLAFGVRRLSGRHAVAAVRDIVEQVFPSLPTWYWSLFTKTHKRTNDLQRIIVSHLGTEFMRMPDNIEFPKVFVTTSTSVWGASNRPTVLIRNYETKTKEEPSNADWLVWEAGRATSAAPFYFRPLVHNGTRYYDGGLVSNNPSSLALREVMSVLGNRVRLMVSIGCGTGETQRKRNTEDFLLKFVGVNTDTHSVDMEMEIAKVEHQFVYIRLNPVIEERFCHLALLPSEVVELEGKIDTWLSETEQQQKLQRIADLLSTSSKITTQ